MRRYFHITATLLFGIALHLFSCKNAVNGNLETVENHDEQGVLLEKYTRRKTDFAKEGLYQRFGPKGNLLEEATFVNDKMDGEHKFFYPNSSIDILEHYKNGVIDGKYEKYYESGKKSLEQDFKNGVLQGLSIAWYPNGVMKEKVTFENNEENGPFTEWYENGNLKAEGTYATPDDAELDNKEQGELKLYNEQGQLERIMDCERGVCKTRWQKQ